MGNMKKLGIIAIVLVAIIVVGYSCGGGGGSSGSSGDTTVKHIAVDPYIEGARFFEDLNNDGIKDLGEQVSSLTNANGEFTFTNPLTTTATIVLDDSITPTHNGITYTGRVKREITSITASLVASPLTTLLANGWTEIEIVDVLTAAGLTGITTADLTKNPMEGIENLTTVTEAQLVKIRASIAVYSFMSIMDSLIGNGYDIDYATFIAETDAEPALQAMVTSINYCLSPTLLATIQSDMNVAPPGTPAVTAGDIIRTSVAMADWIIPQVVADPTGFDPTPLLAVYATKSYQLGVNFYAIRNRSNSLLIAGMNTFMPGVLITNITTFNSLEINGGGSIAGV